MRSRDLDRSILSDSVQRSSEIFLRYHTAALAKARIHIIYSPSVGNGPIGKDHHCFRSNGRTCLPNELVLPIDNCGVTGKAVFLPVLPYFVFAYIWIHVDQFWKTAGNRQFGAAPGPRLMSELADLLALLVAILGSLSMVVLRNLT